MPDTSPKAQRQKPVSLLKLLAGIIVIVGAIAFWWHRANLADAPEDQKNPEPTLTPEPSNRPTFRSIDEEDIVEVSLTAWEYAYSVKTLTIREGDTVRLHLKSTKGTHDFVVDELDITTREVDTGEETIVEFVADKKGEFTFYCSVMDHRQKGMEGVLIVE